MKTTTKIKILNFFGIFNLIRSAYYWFDTLNPQIIGFYSGFIKRGDLCFDVGANIGRKTDIFLRCKARVVAVEPQADCARFLNQKYRFNKKVTVIEKALDSAEGKKDIYVCEANSLSSMSQEWIQSSRQSGRCAEFQWNKKSEIETTTLDSLIKLYGRPHYCKIDVEGYEINVLKGLTQIIPLISLELAPESKAMIKNCIQHLQQLSPMVVFNLSLGEKGIAFVFKDWVPVEKINEILEPSYNQYRYGEIFARLNPTS